MDPAPAALEGCTPAEPYPQAGELLVSRSGIRGIELGSDAIYFMTSRSIERLPEGSTEPTIVRDGIAPERGLSNAESLLRVNDTHIFWVEAGAVWTAPTSGEGDPQMLIDGLGKLLVIALDGGYLYYASVENLFGRVPVGGGAAEVLLEDDFLVAFVIHGDQIYFSSSNRHRVGRIPINGGPAQLYSPDIDVPGGIAVDDVNVYWASRAVMYASRMDTPDPSMNMIVGRAPETETIGAGTDVTEMHVQGNRIYFMGSNDVIGWMATDGSQCGHLARGQEFNLRANVLYTVDDESGIRRVTL